MMTLSTTTAETALSGSGDVVRKRRIFVVEDHPMVRERLAQVIDAEADLQHCGDCGSAEEATPLLRELQPDLVVVDLTLPGASGLMLIKSLQALNLDVPVLVLSMHEETLYAERVIRAGARGYITKHRAATEVVQAIRKVLAGEIYLSDQAAIDIVRTLQPSQPGGPARPLRKLTNRELEVLRLIAQGRTTREIAERLGLGVASIDTYRARIKEKMNLRNAVELQCFAIRWASEGA